MLISAFIYENIRKCLSVSINIPYIPAMIANSPWLPPPNIDPLKIYFKKYKFLKIGAVVFELSNDQCYIFADSLG